MYIYKHTLTDLYLIYFFLYSSINSIYIHADRFISYIFSSIFFYAQYIYTRFLKLRIGNREYLIINVENRLLYDQRKKSQIVHVFLCTYLCYKKKPSELLII